MRRPELLVTTRAGFAASFPLRRPVEKIGAISREDALTLEAEVDDEAALLNLRYALGDALELCRGISVAHKSDGVVIEQMVKSATLQVMLLLKLQQTNLAAAMDQARLLASAA